MFPSRPRQSAVFLWHVLHALVGQQGTLLRVDVLARFGANEEAVVRGVLSDLTDSGLLFRTGASDRTNAPRARLASSSRVSACPHA